MMVAHTEMRHSVWTGEGVQEAYLEKVMFGKKRALGRGPRKDMKIWGNRMSLGNHKCGVFQRAPARNFIFLALFSHRSGVSVVLCWWVGQDVDPWKRAARAGTVSLLLIRSIHSHVWFSRATGRLGSSLCVCFSTLRAQNVIVPCTVFPEFRLGGGPFSVTLTWGHGIKI